MIDELELNDKQAKEIIKIAIKQNAYDSDMPNSKKERLEAAHEIVAFCIDAWKNDGARPDDKDEEIAEGARAILEIFDIAGIEADDDGTIEFADAESDDEEEENDVEDEEDEEEDYEEYDDDEDEEDEELEDEEDEDEEDEDEEGPFDPDDYIEGGYTELTPASRVKRLKDLDPDDEDYEAVLVAIKEWEEAQDKPASRVLDYLADIIGEDEDEEVEDEEEEVDEDEEEVEDEEEDEEEQDESEEPWDGYDSSTAVEVKQTLNEAAEADELTQEQIDYVREYEQGRAQPRKRILNLLDELEASLGEETDEEDEDEAEEQAPKPRKSKRGNELTGMTIEYVVGDETFEVEGVTELSVRA